MMYGVYLYIYYYIYILFKISKYSNLINIYIFNKYYLLIDILGSFELFGFD